VVDRVKRSIKLTPKFCLAIVTQTHNRQGAVAFQATRPSQPFASWRLGVRLSPRLCLFLLASLKKKAQPRNISKWRLGLLLFLEV
jgi:hypothetical protein